MYFIACACVLFGGLNASADDTMVIDECNVWIEYYNGNITEEEAEAECLKIELDYWTDFYMTSTVAETTAETTTTTVTTTTEVTTTEEETNFTNTYNVVEVLAEETTTEVTTTEEETTTEVTTTETKSNGCRVEYYDYENDVTVVEEEITTDNETTYRYVEYDENVTFSETYVEIELVEYAEIPTLAAKENCVNDTISEVIANVTDIYINYYSGEIDEQTARENEVVSLINYYIVNPTAPTIDLTF
jgi:hypothetical protein